MSDTACSSDHGFNFSEWLQMDLQVSGVEVPLSKCINSVALAHLRKPTIFHNQPIYYDSLISPDLQTAKTPSKQST